MNTFFETYRFLPKIKFLPILLILISNLISAQEITLKDAHNMMLENNGNIKASIYEVKEKEQ